MYAVAFLTFFLSIDLYFFANSFSAHLKLGESFRDMVLARNFKKLQPTCAEEKFSFGAGYCKTQLLVHGEEWKLLCKNTEHFMHRYYRITENCDLFGRRISSYEYLLFQ